MARMLAAKGRRRGALTRLTGVVLSLSLLTVAAFNGRELCFCQGEFDEACQTRHCLSCEPCSPQVNSGDALSLTGEHDCDHILIDGVDMLASSGDSGLCSFGDLVLWIAPADDVPFISKPDGYLPPATAPPDGGGDYLIYRVRALLRS